MDENLEAYLTQQESTRNPPLSGDQMAKLRAKELSIDAEAASLADIPYDSVLTQSLRAYKAGEVESFRGKTYAQMQIEDLRVVRTPYVAIGIVVLVFLVIFAVTKMPNTGAHDKQMGLGATFRLLFRSRIVSENVSSHRWPCSYPLWCRTPD